MVNIRQLSPKEGLVDILKSKGLKYKQIAFLLNIESSTVKTHLRNIKIKKEAWTRNVATKNNSNSTHNIR